MTEEQALAFALQRLLNMVLHFRIVVIIDHEGFPVYLTTLVVV
jgi:hypothetical protein